MWLVLILAKFGVEVVIDIINFYEGISVDEIVEIDWSKLFNGNFSLVDFMVDFLNN